MTSQHTQVADRMRDVSTAGLAGRVALVTGGSGGIGRALVRRLAADGAAVAVAYSAHACAAEKTATQAAEAGVRAIAVGADLRRPQAPAELVDAVERALGPVDVLVANAGTGRARPWEAVSSADFDEAIAVNLRAPFLLAQRTLPGMHERRFGRILFISSVAAFTGGLIGPHYAASKAGLHGLTHFLAARTAPFGVTVNALAPALIAETGLLPGDPRSCASRSRCAGLATRTRSLTWRWRSCASPISPTRLSRSTAACTRDKRSPVQTILKRQSCST